MAIQIAQEQQDGVRILALSGRLDTETAADVELALQDLLAAGERRYLVDLAGIGYVSSAGLRVLLALAKKLDGGKGELKLCGLNVSVRQVFDVAGFSRLFAIFPNRDAAFGQAPKLRPEAELAQHAARLLGAGSLPAPPHAQAEALARAAASVLGLKPTAAAYVSAVGITPVRAVPPPVKPAGFMARLKGMFGKSS
ncbi:MAG: STAS domain-containing protein [Xanthomonadaceae bacterium]|nr:STAS domain-containing protein [Xanthomonadaceae bacterium]MDE1884526.1 STAS domain-containing protein [Xanthomonadaceae bacterium]MDE1960213.1 STAS domain-containing protein [Xanthomonadaceae bacterium]MDE2083810.1 STAS domain-containing protein [Xanthomonadaceae bacterium]MDE2258249.1 STAS domain-containing protein [Xanthomonadaceae bacterium]